MAFNQGNENSTPGGDGITYGGAVGGGNPNQVLYISPAGLLTSDSLFTRNVTTGEFSAAGALTADPFAISAVGVGTIEAMGAYLNHNDPTNGLNAFFLSGDLTSAGLSTGTIGGVVGASGLAGDGTYILSAKIGSNYFTNIPAINGNLEAIVGASNNSAKLTFSDVTTNVTTYCRAELAHAEMLYEDSVTGENAFIEAEAGRSSMSYTSDGVTTYGWYVSGAGVSFNIDNVAEYTFPLADGTAGQALVTDGAGVLDWASVGQAFTIDGDDNMYAGTGAMSSLTSGTLNFAVGINAGATIQDGTGNTIIGYTADVSSDATVCTAIGFTSFASGNGAVAVGASASAQGSGSVSVGSTTIQATNSIALGGLNAVIVNNTFCVGATGANGGLVNTYFGNITDGTPVNTTLNATGGSGTNIAGATLGLAGGKATGDSDVGGYIPIYTSNAVASGTTLQSLTEKVRVTKLGDLVVLDSAKGIVLKDTAGTPHYWRISVSTLGVLSTSDLGTSIPT